jgi:hypothetical protein
MSVLGVSLTLRAGSHRLPCVVLCIFARFATATMHVQGTAWSVCRFLDKGSFVSAISGPEGIVSGWKIWAVRKTVRAAKFRSVRPAPINIPAIRAHSLPQTA